MSAIDDSTRLRHMQEAAQAALQFMKGKDRAALDNDLQLVFAVVRAVEIIGEAASHISPEFRQQNPQFPWAAIVGMRNRLVHAYFDVDLEQVWKTVKNDLPLLIAELGKVIPSDNPNDPQNTDSSN